MLTIQPSSVVPSSFTTVVGATAAPRPPLSFTMTASARHEILRAGTLMPPSDDVVAGQLQVTSADASAADLVLHNVVAIGVGVQGHHEGVAIRLHELDVTIERSAYVVQHSQRHLFPLSTWARHGGFLGWYRRCAY
jgi:hypothetical protein